MFIKSTRLTVRTSTIVAAAGASTAMMLACAGVASAAAFPVTTASGAAVLHCNINYFCAYMHGEYNHLLLKSNAPRGTSRVSVAGGTSSGSNNTSNYWKGVNDLCCGLPDDDIFIWAPHTEANLGKDQNDEINYFVVQ